jgi:hypothetical protein
MFKKFSKLRIFVEKICKMGCLEVAVWPSYIQDVRLRKVNVVKLQFHEIVRLNYIKVLFGRR